MTIEREVHDYQATYPMDDNGNCAVARPAQRIPAHEVRRGDTLILDGYISKVTQVTERSLDTSTLTNGWPVLHIQGPLNIIRFPHELVTVLR